MVMERNSADCSSASAGICSGAAPRARRKRSSGSSGGKGSVPEKPRRSMKSCGTVTDPMTVAIATAMAGKAVEVAGEPVRAAAAELSRRVRERFRGRPSGEEALERATGDPTPERVAALAAAIGHLMEDDPRFGAEARSLWNQAQTNAAATGDGVANVLNGQAGRVVQLRDVHGDLNIG